MFEKICKGKFLKNYWWATYLNRKFVIIIKKSGGIVNWEWIVKNYYRLNELPLQ